MIQHDGAGWENSRPAPCGWIDAAGGPADLFNVMALLFLLIWLTSYYIAAYNVRQYVERTTLYDTLSWALQLAVVGSAFWWVFIQAGLVDVLMLAVG